MTFRSTISGSIPALITPMRADGRVDHKTLLQLVDWHLEQGSDGLVAVGTTGESATLDVTEHMAVITSIVRHVNGRIPVIAGTGANATEEAITLTRAAADVGADAALLVTPYYNKPPQAGLYAHFAAVAEAVDIPQILYNVPGRTGCDLLPQTVGRLLDVPNIVAIKEASGSQDRIRALLALGGGLVVLSGDDATARDSILLGARGDISVTANVAPAAMHAMCAAALAGDAALAAEIDAPLAGLHQHLFCEPNPIPVKWALEQMGRAGGGIRLPLVPLADHLHATVRAALIQAGALQE
ncbi:MAG: 4-hydroxy-tetrahydrodipicolinate synthase [Oceanococcaceae bacterium]